MKYCPYRAEILNIDIKTQGVAIGLSYNWLSAKTITLFTLGNLHFTFHTIKAQSEFLPVILQKQRFTCG